MVAEGPERTEERGVGRLVTQGADDVVLVERFRKSGERLGEIVEDAVALALGFRSRLLDGRGRRGSGRRVRDGLPKAPEGADPRLVSRVHERDVCLVLRLERPQALLEFRPGHGGLLPRSIRSQPPPRRGLPRPGGRFSPAVRTVGTERGNVHPDGGTVRTRRGTVHPER